jgi:hypothetical protein
MNKLKITIGFLLSFFFFTTQSQAQDYSLAGGVRLGYPWSLSLKTFIAEGNAIEAFAGSRGFGYIGSGYRSYLVGAAYQLHFPLEIDELPGLYWYVGGGGSMYFYSYRNSFVDDRVDSSFAIQGYAGLDYAFEDVPLNVSIDWSPTIIFRGFDSGFGGDYGSVAVRYILSR